MAVLHPGVYWDSRICPGGLPAPRDTSITLDTTLVVFIFKVPYPPHPIM